MDLSGYDEWKTRDRATVRKSGQWDEIVSRSFNGSEE